jgi:predicted RecA/RadA family phage recombinase
MKNFVQAGNVITLPAPYALASGDGCLVGSIFGVATNAAASGASVEVWVDAAVVSVTAVTADTGGVGTKMYWDNTAKKLTTTVGSNSLVGVLTVAKLGTDTTATVRLNGVSV